MIRAALGCRFECRWGRNDDERRTRFAGLVDLSFLLGTTAGYVSAARKADRTAAWLAAPYLGWLAFATVLNAEIVRRNRLLP